MMYTVVSPLLIINAEMTILWICLIIVLLVYILKTFFYLLEDPANTQISMIHIHKIKFIKIKCVPSLKHVILRSSQPQSKIRVARLPLST